MKFYSMLALAGFLTAQASERPPQFEDTPPVELGKLDFLLGKWDGVLEVVFFTTPPMETRGTLLVRRHMDGHALALEAVVAGKTAAEGRLTYDTVGKMYRGVFTFRGLAGGWSARGNLAGAELRLLARGIDAEYGTLNVTLKRSGARMVVDFSPTKGGHKDDRVRLTLTRA